MHKDPDFHRLLYKIAQSYYVEELTQQQIAARYRLSRPKVSRLLQQARDEKIVNITLIPPTGGMANLESRIEKKYGLDEVVVVSVSDYQNHNAVARELGPSAAKFLIRSIHECKVVGIAWGSTILATVDALATDSLSDLTLVQMIGGLGTVSTDEHSAELVRRAAQKLNAKYQLIPAPGIVSNRAAAQALKSDSQIAETLALAAKSDMALVGLGVIAPDAVLFQHSNILGDKDIQLLKKNGAVGDIVLRFLDDKGKVLDLEINKRIIGLSLEQIRKIPRVIAVAGGEKKYPIILAALRSKILHVLITDHITAQKLSEEK